MDTPLSAVTDEDSDVWEKAFADAASAMRAEEYSPTYQTDLQRERDLMAKDPRRRFRVVKVLSTGLHATVCEAVDLLTAQRVVVKEIPLRGPKGDTNRELFQREVMFLERAEEGAVEILGSFYDEECAWIVTEMADCDLFMYVTSRGSVSEEDAKPIVRKIVDIVARLHSRKIVHRDIKPENVVLFAKPTPTPHFKSVTALRGVEVEPKLIDMADASRARTHRVYRDLVGTLCYLAPERFVEHYGWQLKASDVWALGVLAFEVVTGKRCFHGATRDDMVNRIRRGKWEYPDDFKPSPLFRHFLKMALTPDSTRRPRAEVLAMHPWLADCSKVSAEAVLNFAEEVPTNVPRCASYWTRRP